ncbi:hypothetical protein B6N60_04871 [Richelia sinica FACHB-800]|uniref:Uncharacterized protein n=1 Tax=Richelia sinica FACHB-800 TaxID=1357546 RepID=A0A975TCB8_9NOST|nr:hypothetical protein [Richelia sinica]QXE26140.1 hypothetical protein B6N60_04871 [Richelia sinica FACHB-800]
MYELGCSREKIIQLFRLIDRLMTLPPDLDLNFKTELQRFEAEKQMTYITSIQRIERAQTLQESIVKILKTRFEDAPSELVEQIKQIYDHERLNQLLEQSVTIGSISEFQQQLNQENPNIDEKRI